ncbi:hypothetical protein MUK70_23680 [Dyadobacter chenwenxiniae]|uniref:Uncharacterized protein n=1 Tax=Dyadobacter chenwenxiniae TaxID=2906456 RepID=A0A9X1PQS8_9BACT|nr:hypothetical protein [Dyadobacter chenwenxiniae]MCF0065717.1 hypothetical protein [Dyadobacter chenwenxiniae]UON82040.1 hypothetical protein MUK70_23680 [Dyadobacter chenwenxiniae]
MQLHTFIKSGLLFGIVLAFAAFNQSSAQAPAKNDVIIKRDSSRIQALITQMSYEKINYRDLGTADSTKSYIYLDKVARVILKTGKIINVRDSVLAGHVPPDSVGQYADMANLPTDKFERSVVMANSDQLRDKYRYHHDRSLDGKTGAIVFTSFAAASLVSGIIIAGSGTSPDNKTIGNSLAIAGPAVGVGLGLIGFRNYKFHSKKAGKVKNELVRRNQSLSNLTISPNLDPFNKSGLLTLRMSF